MRGKRIRVILLTCCGALLLSGCGGSGDDSGSSATGSAGTTTSTTSLNFGVFADDVDALRNAGFAVPTTGDELSNDYNGVAAQARIHAGRGKEEYYAVQFASPADANTAAAPFEQAGRRTLTKVIGPTLYYVTVYAGGKEPSPAEFARFISLAKPQ
ncbi:MAG TPA: hypothetical protein VEK39_01425 [Solirubrobacterales bacterium]|nr:hypothetical protein [Solirubrobacterales bacterium]